ncbi:MAG TPA: NfeD family protein [Bacteroidales bacterium]
MWPVIIILILIGLIMLILEILMLPGGIAGVIGFCLMIAGIWTAYTNEGAVAGNITLVVTLAVNIVGLIMALRSKTWRKAMLSAKIDSRVNVVDPSDLKAGDIGRTVSRCAPMGKAIFNDKYFEVSTNTEFIDQDVEIEILRIDGKKIIVKQKK